MRPILLSALLSSLVSAFVTAAVFNLLPHQAFAQDTGGAVIGDSFVLMKNGAIRATLAVDEAPPNGVQLVLYGALDNSDPSALGPQLKLSADANGTFVTMSGGATPKPFVVIGAKSIPSVALYSGNPSPEAYPAAEIAVSADGRGIATVRGGPRGGAFVSFDANGNPVWASSYNPVRPGP